MSRSYKDHTGVKCFRNVRTGSIRRTESKALQMLQEFGVSSVRLSSRLNNLPSSWDDIHTSTKEKHQSRVKHR